MKEMTLNQAKKTLFWAKIVVGTLLLVVLTALWMVEPAACIALVLIFAFAALLTKGATMVGQAIAVVEIEKDKERRKGR